MGFCSCYLAKCLTALSKLRRKGQEEKNHSPDCDKGGKKAITVCKNPSTLVAIPPSPSANTSPADVHLRATLLYSDRRPEQEPDDVCHSRDNRVPSQITSFRSCCRPA